MSYKKSETFVKQARRIVQVLETITETVKTKCSLSSASGYFPNFVDLRYLLSLKNYINNIS